MKEKESDVRRIANELEIARRTITSCDERCKEVEENSKNMARVYQMEIDQLRKKDSQHKNLK